MNIADLVPSDYVIVEINLDLLVKYASAELLERRGWQSAPEAGWSYRVDPPRPEWSQMRHVHVGLTKHTSAKNNQASWNTDGSRHDRSTFSAKTGSSSTAQMIARRVLNLPDHILLEAFEPEIEVLTVLTESVDVDTASLQPTILRLRDQNTLDLL